MEHDTTLSQEESSKSYTVEWYHPTTGLAVTPTAAKWTLTDGNGNVINSRLDVALTPGETNNVVLAGDDLQILDQTNSKEYRVLTVYGDAADASIPIIETIDFYIENLDAVT